MKTIVRASVSRILCDSFAICVGFFALSGAVVTLDDISSSFFCALLWLSLACGAVVGLGFGVSESPKVRRWLGVPVFVLCILHMAVQGRLFALGLYDQLTIPMCVLSFVSVSLLLCWLADRVIARHIQPSLTLRLKYRFARVFCGLASVLFLLTLIVGCYMCVQLDDLPKQLLVMLNLTWVVSSLWAGVAAFGLLTCPKQATLTLGESPVLTFIGAGIACNFIGSLGFALQGGQPTMLTALSMVALAAIVVIVLMRHKFDTSKPLVLQLAVST